MKTSLFFVTTLICLATALSHEDNPLIVKQQSDEVDAARHLLSELHQVEAGLRELADDCTKLSCTSDKLATKVTSLTSLRTSVENGLSPLNSFFASVLDIKTKVSNAVTIRSALDIAMKIAAQIPYVGPLFNAVSTVLGLFETPLSTLKDAMNTATSTVVTPWDTAVTDTLTRIGSVEGALLGSLSGIGDFSKFMDNQCIPQTFGMLVPGFNTAYNTVESAVATLLDTVSGMVSAMQALVNALSSSAWRTIKSGLQFVVDTFGLILSPLEALSPITDLLEKKITISWPNGINDKRYGGLPASCPSGYSKSAGFCTENCPSGYSGKSQVLCIATCPSGYRDLGATCNNKYYKVRDIKLPNWKGKCKGDWSKHNGVCWRKCDSGWSSKSFGVFGVCYKDCPSGFGITPDKSQCTRKTKSRKTKPFTCASGYGLIPEAVGCYKKCAAGETDGRYICFTTKDMSFKISSLQAELDKVINKIKDLPIMSTIESAINTLVKQVLNPILDKLGLPTVDSIPGMPSMNLNALPVTSVVNKLTSFANFDLVGGFDFDVIDNQMAKIASGFGMSNILDLANCGQSVNCVMQALGLGDLPLPDNLFDELVADFNVESSATALADIIYETAGCAETMTVDVPIVEEFAKLLNIGGSVSDCSLEFEICKKLDIDDAILDEAMERLTTGYETLINKISSLIEALSGRRLRARQLLPDIGEVFDKDNFEVGLPAIPLYKLIPDFKFYSSGQVTKWLWIKKKTGERRTLGGYVSLDPERTKMVVSLGKEEGRFLTRLDVRFGVQVQFHHIRDNIRGLLISVYDKLQVKAASMIGNQCMDEYSNGEFGCPELGDCKELCEARNDVDEPDEWEWEGPSSQHPQELIDQYQEDDEYWLTDAGFERGQKLLNYMKKLFSRMDNAEFALRFVPYSKKYLKNAGWDWLLSQSLRVYGRRLSDYGLDFGIRVDRPGRQGFEKKSSNVFAEVKFNTLDFLGEKTVTPAKLVRGVYFGATIAHKSNPLYDSAVNTKEKALFAFNIGAEALIKKWVKSSNGGSGGDDDSDCEDLYADWSNSEGQDCAFFAGDDLMCGETGGLFPDATYGKVANEVCCACTTAP